MENVAYLLSISKASKIFGIGQHTLRNLAKQDYNRIYTVMVGNRTMIKTEQFKKFLDSSESIPAYTN